MTFQKSKLAIKLLLIIVPLALLNLLYMQSDYRSDTLKFKNVPYGIQLANTGSSHEELGIDYSQLSSEYTTFNFALGAQTFLYDNHILDEYISHFAEDAVLLIAVNKTSLTSHTPRETLETYKYRYNQFLSKENIEYWTLNEYIIDRYFPAFSSKHPFKKIKEFTAGALRKIKHAIVPEKKKISASDIIMASLSFADKEKLAQMEQVSWKIKDWEKLFPYAGDIGFEENLFYAMQLLDKCASHGIKPVLISLPITQVMSENFETVYKNLTPTSRTTQADYETFIAKIKEKYPDISILDYTQDEEFTTNYSYFMDVDHLNDKGAEVFSKKLFSDLRDLKIIR